MNETDSIDIFNLPGYFTSAELSEKLAILHRRKAWLNVRIRENQQALTGADKIIRDKVIPTLNKLLNEQSAISELIKEFSMLYNSALDRILIDQLKREQPALFHSLLNKAKEIYDNKQRMEVSVG